MFFIYLFIIIIFNFINNFGYGCPFFGLSTCPPKCLCTCLYSHTHIISHTHYITHTSYSHTHYLTHTHTHTHTQQHTTTHIPTPHPPNPPHTTTKIVCMGL